MKGGVGKSTLAINLAWHFAGLREWNNKVLVVDLDPQFNASQYLLGANRYTEIINRKIPTVWDIFEQFTQIPGKAIKPLDPASALYNVVKFIGGSRIDLIPSRLELAYSLRNPAQKEILLTKFIEEIEKNYNLIIMDCAPTESLLTIAAYLASDYILVPVKPEYLSSIGLPLLVRSLSEFNTGPYKDHNLELAGIVFNNCSDYVPEEIKSKNEVKAIAAQNNWYIFETEISYSRSYPKGAREGKPIFHTSYSRSDRAAEFQKFARELANRINL